MIVMVLELLRDTLDLFQTLRPMDGEALFFVASMISLDMSIGLSRQLHRLPL